MTPNAQRRGRWGEEVAARYLVRKHYQILAQNWRHGRGEIDIIALGDGVLVFVEVKTRSLTDPIGGYAPAAHFRKQSILRRTAEAFLGRWGDPHFAHRFDIIEILTPSRHFVAEKIFHYEGIGSSTGRDT
jgi:putative endonuclease